MADSRSIEDFSRIFVKERDASFLTIHVFDLYHSPQRLKQNQYDIVYRILLDKEYEALLTRAGFTDIQIYGDDVSSYNKDGKRLIVVARTPWFFRANVIAKNNPPSFRWGIIAFTHFAIISPAFLPNPLPR